MKTFTIALTAGAARWRTLVVLALAAALGGLAGPGDAEASHSGCDKEWVGHSSLDADWNDGSNWTGGTVPTASDRVCLDAAIPRIVTLGRFGRAASLEIENGTLMLEADCGSDAMLVVTRSVRIDEGARLGFNNYCRNTPRDVTLQVDGEIENYGSIEVDGYWHTFGNPGGGRYLRGTLKNWGEVVVREVDLHFDRAGAEWRNAGTLDIESGRSVFVGGSRFSSEGSIDGGGVLSVSSGQFRHHGGRAQEIRLNDSMLELATTSGASFLVSGVVSLYGDVSRTQSIDVVAGCRGSATLSAAEGSTNHGTIELTSEGCAAPARLYVEPARTLTNAGTITISEGAGGGRFLSANVANTGAVAVGHDLSFDWNGASWLNQGSLTLADGATLSLPGSQTTFTNAAGGSIVGQGTGRVSAGGGTFVHGDGTVTGPEPIHLHGSDLTITGTTPASYLWRGGGRLTGNVAGGQVIQLVGDCDQPAELRQTSFINQGTIELTSSQGRCTGGDAQINVFGGKLTNGGRLRVLAGAGGARDLDGQLDNQGLLELGAGTTLHTDGYTETAQATLATSVDSPTSVGALSSSAGATLAGTLAISRASGFGTPVGTSIPVLSTSALAGGWASATGAVIANSVYLRPTYSPLGASLAVRDAWVSHWPTSGPPGSSVNVRAKHFPANTKVALVFTDSAGTQWHIGNRTTDGSGSLSTTITVPAAAIPGNGRLTATSSLAGVTAAASFHVT